MFILSELHVTTLTYSNIIQIDIQTHQLYLNPLANETTYYVQVDTEYLDFSILVNHWGTNLGGIYQGLVISLIFDYNDTEIKSWLISYNDNIEHFFTTETRISGIIRVVFSCMNVDTIGYNLNIDDYFTVWTYELVCKPDFKIYFGVERADYYDELQQIVLDFQKGFSNDSYFSATVTDDINVTRDLIESSFDNYNRHMIFYSSFIENKWYGFNFALEDYNSTDWIIIRLFYDHIEENFIARLFLNKSVSAFEEMPLDQVHSQSEYWWYIDSYYYHPYPPGSSIIVFILNLLKYIVISFLVVGLITAVIRAILKRRPKPDIDFNPSDKYDYMNANIAYNPEPTHAIRFDSVSRDYELKTSEGSKIQCSICMQIIEKNDNIIRCPSCDVAYHKDHLYQWIVGNGTCPTCKARLRITTK